MLLHIRGAFRFVCAGVFSFLIGCAAVNSNAYLHSQCYHYHQNYYLHLDLPESESESDYESESEYLYAFDRFVRKQRPIREKSVVHCSRKDYPREQL